MRVMSVWLLTMCKSHGRGTWCVGRISNWSSTITGTLKSLQRTRSVRGLPCCLPVNLSAVKGDGICWMSWPVWNECSGLACCEAALLCIFCKIWTWDLKGGRCVGLPSLVQQRLSLFLLQFPSWWRCVFWAEDVEPGIPVAWSPL